MRYPGKIMVPVAELKLGMHVCELDRPWMEMPFEPPFQIQGFRIESTDDIEKISRYCDHVFVDVDKMPAETTAPEPQRRSLGRLVPDVLVAALAGIAGRRADSHRKSPRSSRRTPANSPQRHSEAAIDQMFATTDEPLPRRYLALSPRSPARITYRNQATIEEEIEPATAAYDDAASFYEDLAREIVNERQVDVDALSDRIDAMARSIIRNPDALSYLIHLRSFNKHTYNLAISSCVMNMSFGRFLGLAEEEIRTLGTGALLQDVGMINLPRAMLDKPSRLTPVEQRLVMRHARQSAEIVRTIRGISSGAAEICLYHHERIDGSGYPDHLRGDQIPLMAMITGIVDTYMALVSYRPYRKTSTSFQALSEISALRNRQFLGALVERFVRHIAIFPVGSFVELNSGHVGVVVGRNPMHILEPKVMLVLDPAGTRMSRTLTIDFSDENKSRHLEGLRIVGEIVPDDSVLELSEFFT